MTTPLDRAAMAIAGDHWNDPMRQVERNILRQQARAALASIREPTPEMIAAAWRVLNPCGEKCIEQYGLGPAVKEAWQAMIDEMLK